MGVAPIQYPGGPIWTEVLGRKILSCTQGRSGLQKFLCIMAMHTSPWKSLVSREGRKPFFEPCLQVVAWKEFLRNLPHSLHVLSVAFFNSKHFQYCQTPLHDRR